jgi:hypothetical protein
MQRGTRCPENRLAETRLRELEFSMGPWSDTRLALASHHLSRLPQTSGASEQDARSFAFRVCDGGRRFARPNLAQYRPNAATPSPRSKASFDQPPEGPIGSGNRMLGAMAGHHDGERNGISKLRLAALALALTSSPVFADSFQEMWMGRVARPPADNEEASVYWEDTWDARGKRFKADEVSCAHRTEAFGTVFVVTNLDNGKTIKCPVQDRGPYARGRVLDFSLGAARRIGCDGLCRVTVRRAGYE